MSVGKNRLSRGARLLYQLGIPLVISVVVIASPRTAAALPFIALPTLLLLWKLLQLPNFHRPDLETLIWTYFLSGTLGVVLVVTAQSIGGYTLALMLFGSSTDEYLQGEHLMNTATIFHSISLAGWVLTFVSACLQNSDARLSTMSP